MGLCPGPTGLPMLPQAPSAPSPKQQHGDQSIGIASCATRPRQNKKNSGFHAFGADPPRFFLFCLRARGPANSPDALAPKQQHGSNVAGPRFSPLLFSQPSFSLLRVQRGAGRSLMKCDGFCDARQARARHGFCHSRQRSK